MSTKRQWYKIFYNRATSLIFIDTLRSGAYVLTQSFAICKKKGRDFLHSSKIFNNWEALLLCYGYRELLFLATLWAPKRMKIAVNIDSLLLFCVPRARLELARVAPLVFETSASTDSAIWASNSGAKVVSSFRKSKKFTENLVCHPLHLLLRETEFLLAEVHVCLALKGDEVDVCVWHFQS